MSLRQQRHTTMTNNKLMQQYIDHIMSTVFSIKNYFSLKLTGVFTISLYSFFFNIDFQYLMQAMIMLIVFDFVTGILAAKIVGEKINSRKAARSAFKLFVYSMLVSAAHFTDQAFFSTAWSINAEVIMVGFFASTEMISICENAEKMGFVVPSTLLSTLKKYTQQTTTTHQEVSNSLNDNVVSTDIIKTEEIKKI